MEVKISDVSGMKHGESRTFEFIREGKPFEGFLIKVGSEFRAYLNRCAHWPSPLDMGDGDFYHPDFDRIVCKTHGASFQLKDGFCDSGPCEGGRLEAYAVRTAEDVAMVTVE